MQTHEKSRFDSEELLHLALRAMEQNESEKAIIYLKDIIDIEPENSKAHYLLGALHAELRMYERAISEMQRAVSLDPNIPIAHFQLGLLLATSARPDEATEAWEPLDELNENDPLLLFKTGLIHLMKDEFNDCLINLENGINLNQTNPALNNDMLRIIGQINLLLSQSTDTEVTDTKQTDSEDNQSGKHVLLSAYQNTDDAEH